MTNQTSKQFILSALQKGELELQGQFVHGSNYTFMGKISHQEEHWTVVYKPTRGEQPLWDFPAATLARREVVAYLVSEALGWELVPPTVYRRKGPLGPGSVQVFIEHDPEYHYFNFRQEHRDRLQPVVLFDLVINNADRKGGHIIIDGDDHLWLIDHGVCFHVEDKLRTVVWDFAGQPVPEPFQHSLYTLIQRLEDAQDNLRGLLENLLSPPEVNGISLRTHRLLESGCFPHPAPNRRPYPWPPV